MSQSRRRTVVIMANTSWYLWNFRSSTIQLFTKMGLQVICCADDELYKAHLESLGAKFKKIYVKSASINPLLELKTIYSLYKVIRSECDAVFSFTPKCNVYSALVSYLLKTPCIPNVSGLGEGFNQNSIASKFLKLFNYLMSLISTQIFFQNDNDLKLFLEEFNMQNCKAILLPGSGVNLKTFFPSKMPVEKPIRFGLFARLIEEKGVRLFYSAAKHFAKDKRVEFVLAGSFDSARKSAITESEIETWQNEGVLKYLGNLDDVRTELTKCHCVVLPSYYAEGTPKILLEAAAMARPIITTDRPGCRDLLKGNGVLIQPKSLDSLIAAIEKITAMQFNEVEKLGEISRKIAVRDYDENLVLNQYRNCAELLLQ